MAFISLAMTFLIFTITLYPNESKRRIDSHFGLKISLIEGINIPERSMENIKYVIYREDKYYVAQCLNVDVSSFDTTLDAAVANLKEALELFFED